MARSIGSYGVEHEPPTDDPDTFDWFGSPVRLIPGVNEVELVDLMHQARSVDAEDVAAAAIIKDLFLMIIWPDDFAAFWTTAKTKRQEIEDMIELFRVLLQAITDRPTQQPSDSLSGRPTADAKSQPDSLPQVSSGRPDLQIIHDDSAATRERARQAMLAG